MEVRQVCYHPGCIVFQVFASYLNLNYQHLLKVFKVLDPLLERNCLLGWFVETEAALLALSDESPFESSLF
jgi:hypothetical protein